MIPVDPGLVAAFVIGAFFGMLLISLAVVSGRGQDR